MNCNDFFYVARRDAFDDMKRQLDGVVRKRRRQAKRNEGPRQGQTEEKDQ